MSEQTPVIWLHKDEPRGYAFDGSVKLVASHNGSGPAVFLRNEFAAAPDLLAICESLAERECEYGNGANCNMLPQGVVRPVCLPCRAKTLLARATGE